MNSCHALDGRAVRLMLVFCAILWLQQLAIEAAAPDMSPLVQIGLRSGAAALPIGLYLRAKGLGLIPGGGTWLAGIALVSGGQWLTRHLFRVSGQTRKEVSS